MAMIATATADTVKERTAKVVRLKGDARYSTDNNSWQPLKVGMILGSGVVIQTAANSFVDIAIGEQLAAGRKTLVGEWLASEGLGYQPTVQRDVVRLEADTVMAIDKLSVTETGAGEVTDTQLDLRSGRILGAAKKVSAASTFEIKIPNGVAGIRGTIWSLSAYGLLTVWDGAVTIAYNTPQGPKTETVQGGYKFDVTTGILTPLTPEEMSEGKGAPGVQETTGQPTLTVDDVENLTPDNTTGEVSPTTTSTPPPPPPTSGAPSMSGE